MTVPKQIHEPLLAVESLAVRFGGVDGGFLALEDVSFQLEAGETLSLLGESGSGKSVTAQAVMALLPGNAEISGGHIAFSGEDLVSLPRSRTRALCGTQMGMIFQDPLTALNPVFTVGDQIAELFQVRQGYGRRTAWSAAADVIDAVGIPDARHRLNAYPHQFSGGMRQRLVIAMAIALKPRLLIADEPTTALDVTVQAQIMELIGNLQRETGMALLLITHDLGVVADVTDRVAIMYAGRIVETGPVRVVYDHPAHPYTRGLMSSIPSLDESDGPLSTIPGLPPNPRDRPSGCPFHPRCSFAKPVCAVERPPMRALSGGRMAACHFAEEVVRLDPVS
ncbi:ABC transporter ATP-binding protein [Microvirga brassicacearum]|uniref:ABC transporter ATP-binding protein n=1 Tax=Microvirga brassicacearum TaxID=2580413 RepID=A0A5N3PC08_9HYPH|nr:ABC transporter ATP-binding protein [Microvirga brassicacearum]KAB0267241.1 ABC transporter ATP-binding protein [Microvirga brassicacearum]